MKRFLLFIMFVVCGMGVMAQLPKVVLKDMHGKEVSTDTLSNQGKPFIIDFFATWCKPCNRELDAISEVYEDWQQETGVKIIAVSIDQAHNINKVKPLVDSHGWDYEVLLDPNGDLKRAFSIQMIPYVGMGLVFAYIYESNDNIVASVLTHATSNFIAMLLILF